MKPINKKYVRRAFWGALGRLIGVMLGAGAGSLLYQTIGSSGTLSISVASGIAIVAFILIWFAEYEREVDE